MANPFFSIVIPAYNRAHILPKTIDSVLSQTFTDYEIIIVDDGSKDNTKQVLENLRITNLKYIYQSNAERSAARNNGVAHALGAYVCFLDSDDFYLPNHLQNLYNNIKQNNFDIALYFVNCNVLQNEKIFCPKFETLSGDVYKYFIKNSVVPARVCMHRNIFKDFKFDEEIVIVEDTVLWCNVATKYKIHHIQENTILYHLHDDNSVLIAKNCFLPRLKGLQRMFAQPNIKKVISKRDQKVALSDCYFGVARHYEYSRQFWIMLKYLLISIYLQPVFSNAKKKLYMIYAYVMKKPSNNE